MFKAIFRNYKNDFDNYYDTKMFYSLDDLKDYLISELNNRYHTSRDSKYWTNPCGVNTDTKRGWFSTSRDGNSYSLSLKRVFYDNIIIFEENNYTSPKFYEFLKSLKDYLDNSKNTYGDF